MQNPQNCRALSILTSLTLLVAFTSGCGKGKPEFTYDPVTQGCYNASGKRGFNNGYVGECGRLKGDRFKDEKFSGQSFRGAYLYSVSFKNSDLSNADFEGATLRHSQFEKSNLTGVKMAKAEITTTDFRDSDLRDGDLRGLDLDYSSVDLSGSQLNTGTRMHGNVNRAVQLGASLPGLEKKGNWRFVNEQSHPYAIEFSEALTAAEQAWLGADFERLLGLRLDAKDVDGAAKWYPKIFGGTQASDVVRYVTERTRYFQAPGNEGDSNTLAMNPTITNLNPSGKGPTSPYVTYFNGRRIEAKLPRELGLMVLGPAYLNLYYGQVRRMGTLVHEPRHSDCPAWEADNCGHFHVKCPADHNLRGEYACDGRPWGPYSVAGVFLAAVSLGCQNCSEREIQHAIVESQESLSRVLVLDEMLDGKLGDPDMRSL
ncbi:MAG: pentapeptide repeat-containing protein [Bacteriovoracia bacterium]